MKLEKKYYLELLLWDAGDSWVLAAEGLNWDQRLSNDHEKKFMQNRFSSPNL